MEQAHTRPLPTMEEVFPRSRSGLVLLAVGALSYIVSFGLPALHLLGKQNTLGERSDMVGLAAFLCGFFGMFDGQFAFLANPLAWVAAMMILVRQYGASLLPSVAALLMAQHTWRLVGKVIDGDEGGVTKTLVTSLGAGFYLWSASFGLLVLAGAVGWARQRRRRGLLMGQA